MKYLIVACISILYLNACSSSKILTHGALGSDKSLYYHHVGAGDPIIFVHGGPGLNHRYFLPYLTTLSNTNHLIFYDQRACGDSEIPSDTNSMRLSSFVDDINKIKDRFKLKKFTLLGHSWGASLALRYALKYPQNLTNLILVSPAATSYADVREASKQLNSKFEYGDQLKRSQIIESTAFKQGEPFAMADLLRLSFSKNMAKPALADSIDIYIPVDYAKKNGALKYLFKDLVDYDLYPMVSAIKVRTLIVSGENDIGNEKAKKLSLSMPGSELEIISQSGHFPFIENPSNFEAVLKSFLVRKN